MSYPRNPSADRVEQMLLRFESLKNITNETKICAKHVRARANRMGMHKHYLTEAERQLILKHRRESGRLK